MRERRGWNRGRGVVYRPTSGRPHLSWVNNGGRDAPLTPKARTVYRSLLLGLLVVFVVLLVFSVRA